MQPNQPSFDEIYQNYHKVIRRKVHYYVRDRIEAEDALQEVLLKIWRKAEDYDRTKGGLYAWVRIITCTTCIDFLRQRKGMDSLDGEPCALPAGGFAEGDLFIVRHEVRRLFAHLSAEQLIIIKLIYFYGLTLQETAAILGLPLGTVKSRKRAALSTMRRAAA